MPTEITTLTVRPETAARARQYRDANDLSSLDATVQELLDKAD